MIVFIRLVRPFTLIPPIVGMVTGAVAGAAARDVPIDAQRVGYVILGALSAALLNAASNVWNQICDIEQDRVNKPHRPLPSRAVAPRSAHVFAIALASASLLAAAPIDVGAGREFLAIVIFTAFVTWAYSAPPFRWRRFGWRANFVVALPRGLLLKVAGWSCAAPALTDPEPYHLGFVFFLFLLGATTTKDFADVAGDRAAGVATLPVRLGPRRAVRAIAPFFVFPWLLFPLGAAPPDAWFSADPAAIAFVGVVAAGYGAWIVRRLRADPSALARGENHPAWRHMYGLVMFAQFGSAAAYLVG